MLDFTKGCKCFSFDLIKRPVYLVISIYMYVYNTGKKVTGHLWLAITMEYAQLSDSCQSVLLLQKQAIAISSSVTCRNMLPNYSGDSRLVL